jgi:hypothetical protein
VGHRLKKPQSKKSETEIEIEPDAWQRFERAAGVVAKTPPQHRTKQKKKRKSANSSKQVLSRLD